MIVIPEFFMAIVFILMRIFLKNMDRLKTIAKFQARGWVEMIIDNNSILYKKYFLQNIYV